MKRDRFLGLVALCRPCPMRREEVIHLRVARATYTHSRTACGLTLPKSRMRDQLWTPYGKVNCKNCLRTLRGQDA